MRKLFTCFALVVLFWHAYAQNRTVSGTVTDDRGEPLAGATLVSGKSYAITDASGRFSFQAPQGADITVSFLGYDDYVFKATVSGVAIQLTPSAATLLNESVAIGYGTTTKK